MLNGGFNYLYIQKQEDSDKGVIFNCSVIIVGSAAERVRAPFLW